MFRVDFLEEALGFLLEIRARVRIENTVVAEGGQAAR